MSFDNKLKNALEHGKRNTHLYSYVITKQYTLKWILFHLTQILDNILVMKTFPSEACAHICLVINHQWLSDCHYFPY